MGTGRKEGNHIGPGISKVKLYQTVLIFSIRMTGLHCGHTKLFLIAQQLRDVSPLTEFEKCQSIQMLSSHCFVTLNFHIDSSIEKPIAQLEADKSHLPTQFGKSTCSEIKPVLPLVFSISHHGNHPRQILLWQISGWQFRGLAGICKHSINIKRLPFRE